MATYTATSGGGNWNANGTWNLSGYPQAGDNAVFNSSSGNVTVNVASACDDLTCTGYTGTLTINSGFTNALTIYGSLTFSSGMTFVPSSGAVVFAATSTGKTITSAGKIWDNVTFNGSGGGWTIQDTFQLNSGVFTMTAGTLDLSGSIYIWSTSTFTFNGGTINAGAYRLRGEGGGTGQTFSFGTGTTFTISTGIIDDITNVEIVGTATFTITGAATIGVGIGNLKITSSNFSCGTSSISVLQWFSNKNLEVTKPLYNFTCGGPGSGILTLLQDTTILNNLTINPSLYSGNCTLDVDTYNLTIGGSFTNNDLFDAGSGKVIFNDNTKTSTITGSQTFNTLQCLTGGKNIRFYRGQTFTVSSFDFTGSSGSLININSDNGTNTFTLSDSTGTNQVEYCDIHNSVATGGATWNAFTSDGNVDGGGNTGWVFSGGATTTKTQTGKSDIKKTTSRTMNAVSDIKKSTSRTQTGISDIKKATARTIQGLADIKKATTRTQLGKSDILKSTSRTQLGRARITIITSKTQTGIADIKRAVTRTITGISDILKTVTRTIQGRARITATATKTQLGKADVLKTTTRTTTGVATIEIHTLKYQTGKADILKATSRTQLGKSDIKATTSKTQLGKAMISIPTSKTITGKANIKVSTTKTQLGKASIFNSTTRTQLGKARIGSGTQQIITGIANILKPLLWQATANITDIKQFTANITEIKQFTTNITDLKQFTSNL